MVVIDRVQPIWVIQQWEMDLHCVDVNYITFSFSLLFVLI